MTAGLENPTPDVSKAIAEAEAASKDRCSCKLFFLLFVKTFHLSSSLITFIILFISYMLSDANKKPVDNLTKLVALDLDNLFAKTKGISRGVLFNVQQSLLKEWGPDSLGVLLEDIMQELLTGVTF